MSFKPGWAENPKLNPFERVKLQKDGLDIIADITERLAGSGYASISPSDMDLLKWAGVYEQKPREGYFLIRVRINSGILRWEQAEALADIADRYGRGVGSITTRGAVQFHWIQVEHLPDIFARLAAVGLCSFEACGDCPRTIVGNPLAGVDPEELMDTTPLVQQLEDFFLLNRAFSNLPRKFKISISASIRNAGYAQINDVSFTPAVKTIDGEAVTGFHVWVGGGLSSQPYLAQKLDLFVSPEQVVQTAAAVCTVFREYGYREKRSHARLKYLVADWGTDKFLEMLPGLPAEMRGAGEDKLVSWNASYYYGCHPQKQPGKNYIGFGVPAGELTGTELRALAALAKAHGDGCLRTTLSQNMILTGVGDDEVEAVLASPVFTRLHTQPTSFLDHTVACTGNQFCNLAITETKQRAAQITAYLDEALQPHAPVRIHITGCPNACGHRQIADISLQGARIRTEEGSVDAFDLFAGGTLEGAGHFVEKLDLRVRADEAHLVLEKLIRCFQQQRRPDESFYQFYRRVGRDSLLSQVN